MKICENPLCILNTYEIPDEHDKRYAKYYDGDFILKSTDRHMYTFSSGKTFYLCDCCHNAAQMFKLQGEPKGV